MSVEISELAAGEEGLWGEFLEGAANATFYHSLPFTDYYAFKVREVWRLVFRHKGKVVALLPAGLVEREGRLELHSPFSASFSGFAYGRGLGLADALECVRLTEELARETNLASIAIQQPPQIYYREPSELFDYALMHRGFEIENYEVTPYLPLRQDWLSGFSSSTKWAINKLLKGARAHLEVDEDGEGVFRLIREHRQANGIAFPYRFQEVEDLRRRTGGVHFFGLRAGRELWASCFAYALNERCLLCMHWAHDSGANSLRPMPLLIHLMAAWAAERNFSYMDLGTTTQGGVPTPGLTTFKDNFGPAKVLRRRWWKAL